MNRRGADAAAGPVSRARPWYADGLRFRCIPGCTRCCRGTPGDVFVSDREIAAISLFLKMDEAQFRAAFVRPAPGDKLSLRERAGGDCVMLDRKGCSVYPVRPLQCATFPFWPEIIESPEAWERQARSCPGMNDGRLYTLDEIEAAIRRQ